MVYGRKKLTRRDHFHVSNGDVHVRYKLKPKTYLSGSNINFGHTNR